MRPMTFFFVLVWSIVLIFLVINKVTSKKNSNKNKDEPFECGFTSFIQNWTGFFNVSFFQYSFTFLCVDLEIILLTPYTLTAKTISIYGLGIIIVFSALITIGFFFELGKGALNIFNKQQDNLSLNKKSIDNPLVDIVNLTFPQNTLELNQATLNSLFKSLYESRCT